MMSKQQETHMAHAIKLSNEKMQQNEGGPFGAVVVKDGKVISEGWNKVTSTNDPTAHAEVVAIRRACEALNSFDLSGCELYSSCEPCPMCLSAIYWARLDKLYFGASRYDAANIGFDDAFIYDEIPKEITSRKINTTQLSQNEAIAVFKAWQQKLDKIEY